MSRIRRATESGADEATVNALGAQLVFSKQSDGGFTFQAPDGSASSRLYQASESRPTDYPDGIPFIPNEPVSALSVANTVTLMWFKPTNPEALFADLNERTKAERWALKEESEYARVPVRHSEYETNGLIRSILFSGFMVSLIQKRL
jgi:hypothetical protein